MKRRRSLFVVLAGALLLACSCPLVSQVPQATQAPPLPTSNPLDTATAVLPTFTALPVSSPTATLSPTPSVPQVTPDSVNVNCRLGPDVGYDAVDVLAFGQTAQVAGRNDDSSWWYIKLSSFCWVSASVVTISGPLAGIPIIAPPAAIVTKVTVDVDIPSSISCGGPNPVDFSGRITTNGPAKVKFQWEVGGDVSNTTSPETLNFNKAGTKDAPDPGAYNVDCGHYTITLHVLSPNDVSATKKFKISE